MSENMFLKAALHYAAHGIAVVPTVNGTKIPHSGKDRKRKVLIDPDQIRYWWCRWPTAEVSLACGATSGFDALDVDKQYEGLESLDRYEKEHGPIPRAAYQTTPSGGFHVLFKHEPGLKNWTGGQKTAPPGLDRRGENSQVKTWPSNGYKWRRLAQPADLPPWPPALAALYKPAEQPPEPPHKRQKLIGSEATRAARYVETVIEDYVGRIPALPPGCQRGELNSLCFTAGRFLKAAPDVSVEAACAELIGAGLTMVNQSGRARWERHQIEKIVKEAISDGQKAGPATLDLDNPNKCRKRR